MSVTGLERRPCALVVDDDLCNRTLVSEILAVWGYEVHMAGDGKEAVCHLREAPQTTLVVTDYRMPNMNGIELAKHVMDFEPHIKVIVMSGDDPDKIGKAAREAGADFIRKPFNRDGLWASILSAFP